MRLLLHPDPPAGDPPAPLPASTKQLEARIAALETKKEDDGLTAAEKTELRALLAKAKTPAPTPAPAPAPTEGKATSKPGWPW